MIYFVVCTSQVNATLSVALQDFNFSFKLRCECALQKILHEMYCECWMNSLFRQRIIFNHHPQSATDTLPHRHAPCKQMCMNESSIKNRFQMCFTCFQNKCMCSSVLPEEELVLLCFLYKCKGRMNNFTILLLLNIILLL